MRITAIVVAVTAAACGGPSVSPPGPDGPPRDAAVGDGDGAGAGDAAAGDAAIPGADAMPPAIVAIRPAPGAPLWIHDPIRITFNQPIDPATATAATIQLTDGDGAPITAALAIAADATEISVQVGPDDARVGELALAVDSITTAGGAAFPPAQATWSVPAWHRPTSAPDPAPPARPALASLADGAIVVAAETTGGAIAVWAIRDGAWTPLGDPLGTGADTPAIAIDAADHVVVAWHEPGSIHAARWDGAAWIALPSPGAGALPALASAAEPALSYRSSGTIRVRRLVADAWQPVAADIADPPSDAPTIAADATTVAIAYLDGSHRLRVRTSSGGGAWIATPVLAVPHPPASQGTPDHPIALATGGAAIVAYDWYTAHGWSAHVARADAAGWTRLGGELDLDPPGRARGLALAVDADGAPVVAWAELADGVQRGHLARWDGAAWQLVANDTWVADPTRTATTPALVLARGRAPVVAYQSAAFAAAATAPRTIELARWNGPGGPRYGLAGHGSSIGCALGSPPPSTLSATGCFAIAGGHATAGDALVPFDITDELWSDGAAKRRWIVVPDGATVTPATTGAWTVPVGTVLVKEFAIEAASGDPSTRRPMETRFLIRRTASTWDGYSYEWRADGTDADLGPGATEHTTDWPVAGGGVHTHIYPSRADCLRCHNASIGHVLGLRTGQLARRVDYDGVAADQLATLAHVGVIDTVPGDGPYAVYHDPSESLERRVRGYVQANCVDCHNPAGECPQLDLRWETSLADTHLCEQIVPGAPGSSFLYRMVSERPGMPPLATRVTDPLIVDVMAQWIGSMSSCP